MFDFFALLRGSFHPETLRGRREKINKIQVGTGFSIKLRVMGQGALPHHEPDDVTPSFPEGSALRWRTWRVLTVIINMT